MYLSLRGDLSDPAETLLKLRALQSFDRGAACYAIHRTVRCAVRRPLDEVFDDLALHSALVAQRMDHISAVGRAGGIHQRRRQTQNRLRLLHLPHLGRKHEPA
jgi:hypothetical protein